MFFFFYSDLERALLTHDVGHWCLEQHILLSSGRAPPSSGSGVELDNLPTCGDHTLIPETKGDQLAQLVTCL